MLVAIALIEKGMKYHEAVDFIRRLVVHVYLFACTYNVYINVQCMCKISNFHFFLVSFLVKEGEL